MKGLESLDELILTIPICSNESRYAEPQRGLPAHSVLAAADGWSVISTVRTMEATISPYNRLSNHDKLSRDASLASWKFAIGTLADDETFKKYKENPSPLVTIHNGSTKLLKYGNANESDVDSGILVGFGGHCDIISAVGTADLDFDKLTFSCFKRNVAMQLPVIECSCTLLPE
jgi:hypothetical protein